MKEENETLDESTVETPATNNDNMEEENAVPSPTPTDDGELHALDITPSMSRTTNIPPRLPEGYSYASQPAESETKPQSKAKAKPEPAAVPPQPTEPALRSQPTETRSKRYRVRKPNKAWVKTKRVARRYGWLIISPAIAATYPWWGDRVSTLFHSEEPAPAVAADTVPQVRPVVADTDSVPQLTHEDSLRIHDSIRHARWLYWQRTKKRQAADDNVQTEEESNGEAETSTTSSPTTSTHSGTVHRDSL